MNDLGSGDWIGLSEAATICTELLGSKKSEGDVVKMGYLDYTNIPTRLRIYTFARQHISIAPYESTPLEGADTLLKKGPSLSAVELGHLLSHQAPGAGSIFELHCDVLEPLSLLRTTSSTNFAWHAVVRATARQQIPGWDHIIRDEESGTIEHWANVSAGIIQPEIELNWDDLRIDRQELLEMLAEIKKADIPGNSGMGVPAAKANKDISSNERNTLLILIAALCKKCNINTTDRGVAGVIARLVDEIGCSIDEETIRPKLKLIDDAVGRSKLPTADR